MLDILIPRYKVSDYSHRSYNSYEVYVVIGNNRLRYTSMDIG